MPKQSSLAKGIASSKKWFLEWTQGLKSLKGFTSATKFSLTFY